MQAESYPVGEIVCASYKSGEYAGKLLVVQSGRALIEVAAVLKHPAQGDLHHPYQPNVPLFHQRRALAYLEKAWVPLAAVKPYTEPLPPYQESLRQALADEMDRLESMEDHREWAERCLEELRQLKLEYSLA